MAIKITHFLHISIHKRCVTHYKSIVCGIITHFYTLVNFYAFIDINEHFDSIL